MGEELGLGSAVSMALGGMIGGGIYAVFGVVAQLTMYATWFGFVAAGIVAGCAGYSYTKLNALGDERGGSVSFVQEYVENGTLAGMVGWTLLFGYVGAMAMYAYAFAEFTLSLSLPQTLAGLPLRPLISVAVVGLFVGLNLLGARASGSVENALVGGKVAILVAFGIVGLVYLIPVTGNAVRFGLGSLNGLNSLVAAAISFVAFQGWQLLFYDQEAITDAENTLPKAVYIAIPVAVAIYALVAIVTVNLAPAALKSHPHVALKTAGETMVSPWGLGAMGAFVVSISALFSTGSAINATLFSAAYFAKGMLEGDLLPDQIGDADAEGAPGRTIIVLGAGTAALAALGSLHAVTSFASLAFIVVFGAMSFIAFRQRDHDAINPVPPLVGTVGSLAFAPLMLWNLSRREPETFGMVVVLAVVSTLVELLYFERDIIEDELEQLAEDAGARL